MHGGWVSSFKMKLRYGWLIAAGVVLLLGLLGYWQASIDPGNITMKQRGLLLLAVSVVVAGIFVIIATARMWFRHFWRRRYR